MITHLLFGLSLIAWPSGVHYECETRVSAPCDTTDGERCIVTLTTEVCWDGPARDLVPDLGQVCRPMRACAYCCGPGCLEPGWCL